MKTPKKFLLLCTVAILTTALVSWKYFKKSANKLNTSAWSYQHDKNLAELTEADISTLTADDDWFGSPSGSNRLAPPAEDVLIQKIPGDNNHLLMMAFY
jgi:hypothetical protein